MDITDAMNFSNKFHYSKKYIYVENFEDRTQIKTRFYDKVQVSLVKKKIYHPSHFYIISILTNIQNICK